MTMKSLFSVTGRLWRSSRVLRERPLGLVRRRELRAVAVRAWRNDGVLPRVLGARLALLLRRRLRSLLLRHMRLWEVVRGQ